MSIQVTTAFVEQYSANVQHLVQQDGSKLRSSVREEAVTGKNAFFEQIGATAAQRRTSRLRILTGPTSLIMRTRSGCSLIRLLTMPALRLWPWVVRWTKCSSTLLLERPTRAFRVLRLLLARLLLPLAQPASRLLNCLLRKRLWTATMWLRVAALSYVLRIRSLTF